MYDTRKGQQRDRVAGDKRVHPSFPLFHVTITRRVGHVHQRPKMRKVVGFPNLLGMLPVSQAPG